jgi:hypothetical protein
MGDIISLGLFIVVYALLEGELHALIHKTNLNNKEANTKKYQAKFHWLAWSIRFLVSFAILYLSFGIGFALVRYGMMAGSIWLLVFDGWTNVRRGLSVIYVGQNAITDKFFHWITLKINNLFKLHLRAQFISIILKIGFLFSTFLI